MTTQEPREDSEWKGLYRAGGIAALMVSVLMVIDVTFFVVYPQPGTVAGWFALFQSNAIVGIFDFWGWEVPMYVLFVVVFLALCAALRNVSAGRMAIAASLVLLGSGVFLATNNPFSMLSLSRQFAAATTDADRAMFLAAGQTVLTNTNQRLIGGFNTGLFLVSIAGLITSWAMLRSESFGRRTAYVGIVGFALSLADYVREALAPPAVVALVVILSGAVFLLVWFVLVGMRLRRLG